MGFPWGKTFLLGLGFFGISLIWPLFNSYVPSMLEGFGLTTFWIGVVMTLDNYANLFIQPLAGNLSDRTRTRIGRRKPFMLVGAPLAALFFVLIPNMTSLALIIVAILGTNLAMAIFRSPTVALLGDLFKPQQRSQANGVINLMGGLAGAVALFGGAALYDVNESAGLPFLVMAVLMLLAVALVVFVVREPKRAYSNAEWTLEESAAEQSVEREPGLVESALAVFRQRDRSLLLIFLAILCWSTGFNAIEAFFTLYGQNVLGIPVNQASRMLTFFAAAGVICAIPAGLIGARIGRKPLVIGCLIVLIVLFTSGYFVTSVDYVQIMLIIAGAAWTSIIVHALPMVLDAAPSDNPGSYTGQYYIWGSLAAIIGPPLAGAVIELTGNDYRTIFIIAPVFMLLALLAMLRVRGGEATAARS